MNGSAAPAARFSGKNAIVRLTRKIMWPLVRIWLRHGMTNYEIQEILRWTFVQVALQEPEFAIRDREVYSHSNARAAVLTGLPRREVQRLAAQTAPELEEIAGKYHRTARVLAGWYQDPEFRDAEGKPRDLAMRSGSPSFADLCRKYCRDATPRAMADELLQLGNVTKTGNGELRLVSAIYVNAPESNENFEVATGFAEDFMRSMLGVLDTTKPHRPCMRKAYYTDIPADSVPELLDVLHVYMEEFTRKCDAIIGEYRQKRHGLTGRLRRFGIGSFTFFSWCRLSFYRRFSRMRMCNSAQSIRKERVMNLKKGLCNLFILLAGFSATSVTYADMVGTGREAPTATTTTAANDDQSLIDAMIEWLLSDEETEEVSD